MDPLVLTLESSYTARSSKRNVDEHFKTKENILNLQLDLSTPNSVREKFLTKPEVLKKLQNSYENAMKSRKSVKESIHNLIGKKFLLYPILVPVSKLYLLFQKDLKSCSVINSMRYIADLSCIINEIFKISNLARGKKKSIIANMNNVLNQVINFTSNTVSKFYSFTYSPEIIDLFSRENYYLTLNIIRAYEFSILDMLSLKETYQLPLVTPIEWKQDYWNISSRYEKNLYKIFLEELLSTLQECYDMKIPMEKVENDVWPNNLISGICFANNKKFLTSFYFKCGNYEECKQHEVSPNQFSKCKNCGWVRYCSKECQEKHWESTHKNHCQQKLDSNIVEDLLKSRRIMISVSTEEKIEEEILYDGESNN